MFYNFDDFKNKLTGSSVAVVGVGISNKHLLNVLKDIDTKIVLRDKSEISDEIKEMMKGKNIEYITGDNYLENINEKYIFRSPGIMSSKKEFEEAIKNGSVLTSEMEAFFDMCKAKIIGVTGSDGKTTTTTLIGEVLKKAGYTVHIGGNIGTPLIDRLHEIKESDYVVVELSSFQLMSMKKSPDIAVITNIAPNHLDKHKDMDEYIQSKTNIFKNGAKKVVLNAENDITKGYISENTLTFSLKEKQKNGAYLKNDKIYFNDEYIMDREDILIPGIHNVDNFLAVICAVSGICPFEDVREVAKTFGGVEHRIEFVRELDGVKYYNDSIASSPTRAIAGLNAFTDKVIMIAGGSDKNIPFDNLAKEIVKHVKYLIVTGFTQEKIKDAVLKEKKDFPIYVAKDFDDAVHFAHKIAVSKDIVILSPACASFDHFKNFMERGNKFKELVNSL